MRYLLATATAIVLVGGTAHAVPTCTALGYGAVSGAKPNKLYLYFPTSDDSTYPEFGLDGTVTSPAHEFDVSELTNYTGTAADLRNAITDVVTDDYCEFNVEVIQTTTAPPTTFARRNTVAIGTDRVVDGLDVSWGLAQNVDTGDSDVVDFARVWAGSYDVSTALTGANSTLNRWAFAIGGTAAHEGGHNFGISHTAGLVVGPGEDALTNHIMARGSNYSDEDRAGQRRHFSDNEYSILASNVGLSVQTMWNWDFINPNSQTAHQLRMTFLSTESALTVAGPYTGNLSPWSAPTVSAAMGTQTFKGVTYNVFQVTWSTAKAWSGGADGRVAGGGEFHVGTGFTGVDFNTPDPIIITQVDLIGSAGTTLPLHPRLVGFDSGALDASDGSFVINAVNVAGAPLILSDILVQTFPRQISINSMVRGGVEKPTDIFGQPVRPWRQIRVPIRAGTVSQRGDLRIPVARLSDARQFIQRVDKEDCERADRTKGRDTRGCRPGVNVSLFPATSLLVSATVTDPAARRWDRRRKRFVTGPVSTRIFYQIAGRHPDLDRNKVDDFLDILARREIDRDRNGVIDKVQRRVNRPR